MSGAKSTTAEPKIDAAQRIASARGPALSVIVPLYNEQESVQPLYEAIVRAVEPLGRPFEMVFVDDGSKDDTVALAAALARRDSRLRIVKFRRNYGQTAAMAAGIEHARGEVLVTMDGDLQNDPADIALLLEQIEAGFDLVVGWRHNRQDKLITRKIPSRIANWLIGRVTGVPIRDNGCSLKAFRANLIKRIPLYSEMHRFIPAMASIAGPRLAQIKVRHHARRWGQSKYGLSRIYKVLLDLMVIKTIASFASRPLRWFALLSLPLFALAFFAFGQTVVDLLVGGEDHISLPIAGSGVIFLGSALILLCSGALAELIYARGDVRDREFLKLTQTILSTRRNPEADRAL
ncbi:MAG TPA: glycosyltransferase family 2 protein [Steroidobacteraceae bacterium]|nr:glycosyltransferase family 2 protein [Steroidobacteraceae bacterium]